MALKDARSWQLAGAQRDAPEGLRFAQAIEADFTGDEAPDAVAWLASKKQGELHFYPGNGDPPRRVGARPAFVPSGAGCRHTVNLAQTGPHTVVLDITARCQTELIDRAPLRSIQVIAPARSEPGLLALRVASPAAGETHTLSIDSTDRDGDGLDDVKVTIAVAAKDSRHPTSVTFEWLDRPAGAAREMQQPAAAFASIGSTELIRGKGNNSSEWTLERVSNAWRLYATVCAESETPRVFDGEGKPLECGELQPFVDRITEAHVTALLTRGRVLDAFGVLERDGWYHAPVSDKRRGDIEKLLRDAVEQHTPSAVEAPRARPIADPGPPRFSPLRFEQPEPTLLVQTNLGIVRVSRDGEELEPVAPDTGVQAWPLRVEVGGGPTWTSTTHACARSTLLLQLSSDGRREPRPVDEVLAARPGTCGGKPAPSIQQVPLGFGEGVLSAIIAGAHVGPRDVQARAGSPHSPDGKHLVIPTPLGVLVTGGTRPELWTSDELPDAVQLTDCVVANGARAVACIAEGRVVLARR